MIYLQLLLLILLLMVAYYLNHHDYISPGFIFAASFTFSTFWACMYADEWGLGLHDNTFLVIVGGVLLFVLSSGIVHRFSYKRRKRFVLQNQNRTHFPIIIEKWKIDIFIVFESIIIIGCLFFLITRGGSGGNLTESIYGYRNERITGEVTESMPFILRSANYIMIAAGYWFSYVFINNYYAEKKIDIKVALIIGLAIVSTLIEGGRNNAINILLSIFVYTAINKKRENGFTDRLKPKTIITLGVLSVGILYFMVHFAKVLGRKLLFTPMYYLAVYCGAEIKNLDIFLNSTRSTPAIIGEQTFANLVKSFGKYFIPNFDPYYVINPYQRFNGYYLANVYTTFKAYIHDFGYIGMIILVSIMAVICQKVYEKALVTKARPYPRFYMLLYGFIFNTMLFSFFSNKFYENLFSLRFVRYLLCWCLFYLFFCKMRIKSKKHTN